MQDAPRLHLDPGDAALSGGLLLPMGTGHAHYLGAVMRRNAGDPVRLFNARDGEWEAAIEALRKDRGQFRVGNRLRPPVSESGPVLVFAPLKRDATDLVVRMATELGASRLRPVGCERGVAHRVNAERWRAIAVEAAEQCERLSVPAIDPLRPLAELLADWDPEATLLAALERPEADVPGPGGWRRAAAAPSGTGPAVPAILVGPEGGFSPNERALLSRHAFVVPVSLGPLVLRADTAAAAALACLAVPAFRGAEGEPGGPRLPVPPRAP